ncbi:MAG: LicD family protein [Lachnospiraceae bacterium]|nr:LicD family protein [Lachnospiraceae bacterium]
MNKPICLYDEVLNPPATFFEDEVREGFYISSMMKRYWAAQLRVLAEIDRVCRKHDIKWFADCGTLLGVVRHSGFIPWDDDIDICMLRHDWVRFFEVAREELPEEYCILTLKTEPEYTEMLGRIVNAHSIDYSSEHLEKYFGCPYTVGIDIFPLDGISSNKEEEQKRVAYINDIATAISYVKKGLTDSPSCRSLLANIERNNHTTLHRRGDLMRELLFLADDLYRKFPSETASEVVLMQFWVSQGNHKYDKALFCESIPLPFEYVHLPAPARYEEVLQIEYSNFMKIVMPGGVHEYPVFGEQEKMLKERMGCNPYRFTMPKTLPARPDKTSLKQKCLAITSTISRAHLQIDVLCSRGDYDSAGQLLEGCQNLAISLGTSIESRFGEGTALVHLLEEYCEYLYEISGDYRGDESITKLNNMMDTAEELIEEIFDNTGKEILFLPCKAEWWKTMEPEWHRVSANPMNKVYVMPLLYRINDYFGPNGRTTNDRELFPDYVQTVTSEEYDIGLHHPDIIYIQNPYDGWNSAMSVPDYFHSDKLLSYTDELIYIPPYELKDPTLPNDKVSLALKILIEQPAVYYSDRIILNSPVIKRTYIDTLTELTGTTSMSYWDNKIILSDNDYKTTDTVQKYDHLPDDWRKKIGDRKIMVFQVNAPFLYQHGADALDKIRESIETIKSNSDSVCCIFSPHNSLDGITEESLYGKDWLDLASDIGRTDGIIYDHDHLVENCLNDLNGYYGSKGTLAHKCTEAGIPVMLMSVI